MKHTSLMRRPPPLPHVKVRLGVASDPMGFTALVAALLAALFLDNFVVLIATLTSLLALVALAPWIRPVRHRAERRAFVKRLRGLEARRARREVGQLGGLPPALRERYLELKLRMRDVPQGESLNARAGRSASLQARLDELLAAYLRLLVAHGSHERFLASADESSLTRQIDRLEQEIDTASQKVRAVKIARLDILQRRLRRLAEVREQREVITTQLAMIEDIVSLLCEATLMSPDAAFLGDQLDDLLMEVEAVEEAVKALDSPGGALADLARFDRRIAG